MAGLSLSHQPGQPISLAAAVLTDGNRVLVVVIGVVALAALAVAGGKVQRTIKAEEALPLHIPNRFAPGCCRLLGQI